jgi:hypothetical protein
MRTRYLAAVPLALALGLGITAPAFAKAAKPEPKAAKTVAPAHKPTVQPVPKKPTAKPTSKRPPATPFSANGSLVGTDPTAATLTLLVKGGKDKASRGTKLVVKVAAGAKVTLNDAPSTLAALPAGAHVTVVGTSTGTETTVTKVNASAPSASPTPVPSETPEPSESPEPSDSPTA